MRLLWSVYTIIIDQHIVVFTQNSERPNFYKTQLPNTIGIRSISVFLTFP